MIFIFDSEHSYDFVKTEILSVLPKLRSDSIIVVDDIDWSNGFFSICDKHKFHPLLLTDNVKDNLRVRTGLVKLSLGIITTVRLWVKNGIFDSR